MHQTPAFFAIASLAAFGCRDVTRFSTDPGDRFEGTIVAGTFVRAGLGSDVEMCLTLDANHLQDAPGAISSSDGLFHATALRPIPQVWHDPLSTLSFGEGRAQNLVYVATPLGDGAPIDVMVVLSLMQTGGVEVRLIRGAPSSSDAGGAATSDNLFGVFTLTRQKGPCSF
jgi:hypothetical protein